MRFLCVPLFFVCACNQPPEGGDVSISPEAPVTSDDLVAAIGPDATDPNKKDEIAYTWSWSVDGTPAGDIAGATVPADRTAKGQVWAVTVEPSDGKEAGASFTASVTIGNSLPTASNLSIAPMSATVADTLTATYDFADADGEAMVGEVSWMANGTEVGTGDSLVLAALTKGDSITASLVPNDGTADGTAVTAGPIVVSNAPPTVPLAAVTPEAPWRTDPLLCVLSTASTDADADELSYRAEWHVDGELYEEGTTTNFEGDTIPAGQIAFGQVWTCTIIVTDGEASASSAPSAGSGLVLPEGVSHEAGYYWVKADYRASRADHASVCAEVGLSVTPADVELDWSEALLGSIVEGLGMDNVGKVGCCAPALWCWEGGANPYEPTVVVDGTCHSHGFGPKYTNYGTYTTSEFERPVFTCTDKAIKEGPKN